MEALAMAVISLGLLWVMGALILARRSDRWMKRLLKRARADGPFLPCVSIQPEGKAWRVYSWDRVGKITAKALCENLETARALREAWGMA